MIYIILWILIGLASAAGMGYYRYYTGEALTLTKISQLGFGGVIGGPFVTFIFGVFLITDFYLEHGDKVLFKKED
jgi:hypothetical protein